MHESHDETTARGKRGFRTERDPLGDKQVPAEVLYGVQTLRSLETFRISRLRVHPAFVTAYAEIKRAAAEANMRVGKLDEKKGDAIVRAARELADGQWREQFDLDVFQAGAGTSYNMNVNEVIANRALELLGAERGDHERLSPIDDVNMAQSTNDTMPTAMRVASVRLLRELLDALDGLAAAFDGKAREFDDIETAARTHLHDAVPITLGREFGAYAASVRRAAGRLRAVEPALLEVPLGGTAVGTSVNAHEDYPDAVVKRLRKVTGLEVRAAEDRVQSQQSLGDFAALSGMLRVLALELSKIASDLRLLSSGPHTGFDEIELPATQPGSSIMPGKVNPAVAEMLNMTCYHVIGHDAAITMCCDAGQLQLNVTMPYVAYALLESLDVLGAAVRTFDEKAVRVIEAHPERCRELSERSVGRAALYNEELGFLGAAEMANEAVETGRPVDELAAERGLKKKKAKTR